MIENIQHNKYVNTCICIFWSSAVYNGQQIVRRNYNENTALVDAIRDNTILSPKGTRKMDRVRS